MKKLTPNGKTLKPKGGGSSSNMKQLSLMSFFRPADSSGPASSSPLTNKSAANQANLTQSPQTPHTANPESDKENYTKLTLETPHTSEMDMAKHADLHSSPIKPRVKKEPQPAPQEPVATPAPKETKTASPDSNLLTSRRKKNVSYAESDASDDDDVPIIRKRRKVADSDSEDDFKPPAEAEDDDDEHMSDFVAEESDHSEPEEQSDEDDIAPPKKTAKPAQSQSLLGSKFTAGSTYVASLLAKPVQKPKPAKKLFEKENEERYQWLVNIRDAQKRPTDHPDYDPRTLFIPSSAWAKFTAFEKQYWEIKSKMWDTVVFFKKGKFYELYENDASIANTKFDLKIAGGGRANMKLAGIPEMSFEYWAKEFISHGYKIAKVDQVETLLAKEMRGGGSKEEKIIRRELTGVLTGGTLTDMDMIKDDMAIYCMAIKESSNEKGEKVFGVCFVDTSTSELNFIEIVDDDECTKLDTLITQIKPKEVLCEKNNLCPTASKIIKYSAHSSHQIWNTMNPYSEFWDYDTALENLVKSKYYEAQDLDDYSHYPDVLNRFRQDHPVAFNAFGGLLYYLKSLKLDESVMTLGNIREYEVSKSTATHMLLDGITLNNLEILNNNFDGGDKGTLFRLLNRANTPFGKRMMKSWVIHPLLNVKDINERYDAVEFLMNREPELRVSLESCLSQLPDLERLIARVHAKTLRFKDFLKVVEGFEMISKIYKTLAKADLEDSGALKRIFSEFPKQLHNIIASWEDAFDRQEALNNVIVPAEGVDTEFDQSIGIIRDLELQLNDHLKTYRKEYKSHEICYRDSGKELFLIEMPIKIKNIPKDWQQMAATSKVKRYWSPEVKTLVRELMEQKELHKTVCENIRSRLYERFDVNYKIWVAVIKNLGKMDCLVALAKTSETMGFPSCRPTFKTEEAGFISFEELRHPCFTGTADFIPNDIALGRDHANFGLLTGANAAGKSTLMRTTAMAVILSQIGCFLPAAKAELTPVDKIMTRLGANDNIIQGKSTFFVELSETKKILSNATAHSLVILDELGRGGSSSDGFAIAEAVLHHLATHVQPLGFFATHYGSLGLSFVKHPQVRPLRMGIVVNPASRDITFLYKLEEGSALGSFGMNVAAMCGIDGDIVNQAEVAAKVHEQTSKVEAKHATQTAENLSLGLQSDFVWLYKEYSALEKDILRYGEQEKRSALSSIFRCIDLL